MPSWAPPSNGRTTQNEALTTKSDRTLIVATELRRGKHGNPRHNGLDEGRGTDRALQVAGECLALPVPHHSPRALLAGNGAHSPPVESPDRNGTPSGGGCLWPRRSARRKRRSGPQVRSRSR